MSRLGVGRLKYCYSIRGGGKKYSGLQNTTGCACWLRLDSGVMFSYGCIVTCWALWTCFERLSVYLWCVHFTYSYFCTCTMPAGTRNFTVASLTKTFPADKFSPKFQTPFFKTYLNPYPANVENMVCSYQC